MKPLLEQHCTPQQGAPLQAQVVQSLLAQVPGWCLRGNTIERRFGFVDFNATMAFVNAVAAMAQAQDHHPDLSVSYSQCTVRYSTHSVHGLSINDFICAAAINALAN